MMFWVSTYYLGIQALIIELQYINTELFIIIRLRCVAQHSYCIFSFLLLSLINTKWNALRFIPGFAGGHCIGTGGKVFHRQFREYVSDKRRYA